MKAIYKFPTRRTMVLLESEQDQIRWTQAICTNIVEALLGFIHTSSSDIVAAVKTLKRDFVSIGEVAENVALKHFGVECLMAREAVKTAFYMEYGNRLEVLASEPPAGFLQLAAWNVVGPLMGIVMGDTEDNLFKAGNGVTKVLYSRPLRELVNRCRLEQALEDSTSLLESGN